MFWGTALLMCYTLLYAQGSHLVALKGLLGSESTYKISFVRGMNLSTTYYAPQILIEGTHLTHYQALLFLTSDTHIDRHAYSFVFCIESAKIHMLKQLLNGSFNSYLIYWVSYLAPFPHSPPIVLEGFFFFFPVSFQNSGPF